MVARKPAWVFSFSLCPKMCLSKRYSSVLDSWASHIVWKLVPWSPHSLKDYTYSSVNGSQRIHKVGIVWVSRQFVQFLLTTNSHPCPSVMHTLLHSFPLPFARGCFLGVLKEVWLPLQMIQGHSFSSCSLSLNGIWEDNSWQSSPKLFHPRNSGKTRMVDVGGTELQVGLSEGGLLHCSAGVRSPGRWLSRSGLGAPEWLSRAQPSTAETGMCICWAAGPLFILIEKSQNSPAKKPAPIYVSTNRHESAYLPSAYYHWVLQNVWILLN